MFQNGPIQSTCHSIVRQVESVAFPCPTGDASIVFVPHRLLLAAACGNRRARRQGQAPGAGPGAMTHPQAQGQAPGARLRVWQRLAAAIAGPGARQSQGQCT